MSETRSRQYDGQAAVRPASDDSVPLREHLEKLIEDLRRHFDAELAAQAKRFDDLRAADQTALATAFASADKAVQTALQSQRADAARSDAVAEKRFTELNDMRKAVATSAEVDALKGTVVTQQRGLDKIESKLEAHQAAVAGRAGGLKDYVGWIVAAVGIAAGAVAIVVALVHR